MEKDIFHSDVKPAAVPAQSPEEMGVTGSAVHLFLQQTYLSTKYVPGITFCISV